MRAWRTAKAGLRCEQPSRQDDGFNRNDNNQLESEKIMQSRLALITFLDGGEVPPGGGGGGQPPLGIWGPNDPRPTNPIAGMGPGGNFPGGGPTDPPLGMWGPNDPRPSQPIQLPPWAGGWQPIPSHPIVLPPPGWTPPPEIEVTPPAAGETEPVNKLAPVNPMVVPKFILINYPGYGWLMVGQPETKTTPPSTGATPKK